MIVHSYYPVGETRVQRQALALRDAGVDVDVICLRDKDEPNRENVDGVEVYRVPVRRHKGKGVAVQLAEYGAFFIVAMATLTRLLFGRRYDTVQVHNLPDFLVYAAIPAKLTGAKIILDLHDLMPELFAGRFDTDLADRRVRLVTVQERLSGRFADRVVTVTHEWRDTLIERGLPASKAAVVMNLADGRLFTPRAGGDDDDDDDDDGVRLIYHGTFTHRYGVDVAVRAIDIVRRQIPDVRLSLAGAGETRDELVDLVRKLDLGDHVWISPAMMEAEALPDLIGRHDIGLVPNRSNIFTDGILPTKLLEYVAMEVPVVASRTPGVAAYFTDEMVRYATPGDVEDLARAIVELASRPELRRSQIAATAAFTEAYSWESGATEYVELVKGLSRSGIVEPAVD
jgi:glycosyltransferase involved in cell wall biosynthesis